MQVEVINSVLAGKDTLALMPTGGGKSLTYQIPALAKDGICLVITPLIALMNDQVDALKQRNIKAAALHSGLDRREIDFLLDSCIYGSIKLLYCAPERLKTNLFQERLAQMNVNLIAVDEAHCISQWGHDFRPAYLEIATIRELLPEVPVLAVTATATPRVQEEIIDKLKLREPEIFKQSFLRPNLSLSVRVVEDKETKLNEILSKVDGSTIVYVKTRRQAQDLATKIQRAGISSDYYHAGLDPILRQKKQTDWRNNRFRVIVATNAFGMGIDKSEVRLVVHMSPPNSLEAYYQEAGRAGRDGKRAFAVLIVQANDEKLLTEQLDIAHPDVTYLKHVYQCLSNYYKLAIGSGENESFDFDLSEFVNRYDLKSLEVFHAIRRLSEDGLFKYSDALFEPSKVKIMIDHTELYKFQVANGNFDYFIKSLLRLYGGQLFNEFMKISELKLSQFVELNIKEVVKMLSKLNELEVISYIPKSDSAKITFLEPRQDAKILSLNTQRLRLLLKTDRDKMDQVVGYFKNEELCRMAFILIYFGEASHDCGVCDVCLAKQHSMTDSELVKLIRGRLQQTPLTLDDLISHFPALPEKQVISCIRQLKEANEIIQSENSVLSLRKT